MKHNSNRNLLYDQEFSFYKAVLDQSPEGYSLLNSRGEFVGVNQAFCDLTGYSEVELLSMKLRNLVPPGAPLTLFPKLVEGQTGERRIEILRKNGHRLHTSIKGSTLTFADQSYFLGIVTDITAQYVAEGHYKMSEEKYRVLFDSAPDPIVIHDGKTILDLNQATVKALSLSDKKQVLGQDPMSLLHPEDRERARQRLTQLGKNGKSLPTEEFRILLHNDEQRTVIASPTLIEFDGKLAFMVNYHDITARKATSEALLTSKEFAENLMETANTMVVAFDASAHITTFNKFAEELTGYKKEEVIGKNWFDMFIPWRDRETIPALFSEVLKQMPKASQNENYISLKGGDERLIRWSNSVMLSRTGEVQGVLSIGMDITDQKHAEEALRLREEHYRNVVQDQTEYIMRYLPDGSITFVNDSFCRAFQTTPEAAMAQNITLGNRGAEIVRVKNKIKALTPSNPIIVDEHESTTPDGKKVWHLWLDRGIFDDRGELTEIQAVGRDITKRKLAEDELEQALKEARTANKVKDQFIANISHEIRTPLNSLLGFSDILNQTNGESGTEQHEDIFNYINGASKRLMRTVDSMVNISQLEAGNIKIFPETLELVSMAKSVIEEYSQIAEEKGLHIQFKTIMDQATVLADEYCIHQTITNLTDNAIKFTFQGNIKLEIGQRGKRITLSVIDTGIGMSAAYQKRIFEPYTQESEGFTKNYQGLGLGMALTKRYVDLNHVEIELTSEKGIGTTFTLIFPLYKGEANG